MPSPTKIDFEWDLSKENVKPLPSGRSAEQLNKVLSFQRSPVFIRWCEKIRRRFEQALIACPLERKLRLYGRYISWVEETYPSLGAASELRSILYRCVKETSGLEGVHNHPIYVDVWLKLVKYCDAATELFNLLFHKGVGTVSAKFYISWTEHIDNLPEKTSTQPSKKWARLAAIIAHGLRAGAQPIVLLEDRAESLLRSVHYVERLREEERHFEELSGHRRHASQRNSGGSSGERKILAPLQTFEPTDPVAGESSIVPSVRTVHALHPERRGLRSLEGKSDLLREAEESSRRLGIYRDEKSLTDLRNLVPIESGGSDLGKCLSRLAEPVASWNAENVETPVVRLDRRTAVSSNSVPMPTSQRRTLVIYRDPSEKMNRWSSRSSWRASEPSTSTRPRGLRVVTKEEEEEKKHSKEHDSLVYSFECLKRALLGKGELGGKEATEEALDDSECNTAFFCDVDALYSHKEETCFEMNRVVKDVHPSHAIEDTFSLDLDDAHSKSLISEMERLVSDDCWEEEEEAAQTRAVERTDYSSLIRMLEAIIDKAENSNHWGGSK